MSHQAEKQPPPPAAAAEASVAGSFIGGKTARACDSCLGRRARWYCAADDAFLCQACDSSVHSANPLALRHERLRLNTSSSGSGGGATAARGRDCFVPAWHHGFKRKARTPRPHHHSKPVVPELDTSSEIYGEGHDVDEEDQLLYRVPIFDPALAVFNSPSVALGQDSKARATAGGVTGDGGVGLGSTPSDVEMEDFAADVERLLGRGLDGGGSFCFELGMADAREAAATAASVNDSVGGCQLEAVKPEAVEDRLDGAVGLSFEMEVDLSRETLDLDFNCRLPAVEAKAPAPAPDPQEVEEEEDGFPRRMALKLNYEAVLAAWSVQGSSPWTSGERPHLGAEEYWLECMGMWGGGRGGGIVGGIQVMDVGREARVTRYREKRRTRLFSKKIRYEVRKLNAEKRPRMKGRFVKRPPFPAAGGGGGGAAFVY